jgi:hypothetical protein
MAYDPIFTFLPYPGECWRPLRLQSLLPLLLHLGLHLGAQAASSPPCLALPCPLQAAWGACSRCLCLLGL